MSRGKWATAGAVAIVACLCSFEARAQVLEIGDDGRVAVYDGPSVFTDRGAAVIEVARPAPAVRPRVMPVSAAPAHVLREIGDAAAEYSIDPKLLEAVAWRESRFRHSAVSRKGATGVMQLMPGTARDLGVDRFDLRQNIRGGAAYLSSMMRRFGGNVALSLAAYNAGPGAVARYRGVPPFAETRAYVAAIMNRAGAASAAPAAEIPTWEGLVR